MVIEDIFGLYAAINKVCPIEGVSGDGQIWFREEATDEQKAAARHVLENFQDTPRNEPKVPMAPPLPPPKSIFEP